MSLLDDIQNQLNKKFMAGQPSAIPGMDGIIQQAQQVQEKVTGESGAQITTPAPEASPYNQVDSNTIVVSGDNNRDRPSLLVSRDGDQIVDHSEAPTTATRLFNRAEDQAVRMNELIEDQEVALEDIQERQTTNLNTKLAVTDRILEEQQAAAEKLKNITNPLFKARQDTQQNMQAIREENPLIAGIRGIFDLRYNRDYQQQQLGLIDQEIQGVAKEFQFYDEIQNDLLRISEGKYVNAEAVTDLALKHMDQDLAMGARKYTTLLDDIKLFSEQLQTNSQMTSARILARNEQLDMLSAADANKLLGQARKAGGVVDYNGIELSEGQLTQVVQQREKEALAVQSARLSVQGQQLDNSRARLQLSMLAKTHALENMSRATIEKALANNGVVGGVQYDIRDLVSRMEGFKARDDQMVQQTLAGDPQGRVGLRMREFGGFMKNNLAAISSTDLGSPALTREYTKIQRELKGVNERLEKARKGGYIDRQAEAEMARIDALEQSLVQQLAAFSESMGGNSDNIKKAMFGHLTGTPVAPDVALGALVDSAVDGAGKLPGRSSPMDIAIMNRARQELAALRRANKGASKEQLKQALKEKMADVIPSVAQQTVVPSIMGNIQKIATQAGHPFQGVPQRVFNAAAQAADQQTYDSLARTMRQPASVIKEVIEGRNVQGINAQTVKEMQRAFQETHAVQLAANLDRMSPKLEGGARPSQLYADFLGSSRFQTVAQNYEYGLSRLSFTGFIAAQGGMSNIAGFAGNYANLVQTSVAQTAAAEALGTKNLQDRYNMSPRKRNDAILAAAGLTREERKALIDAAELTIRGNRSAFATGAMGPATLRESRDSYGVQLKNAILTSAELSQDPQLKRLQMKAAKGYEQAEQFTSRFVESISEED